MLLTHLIFWLSDHLSTILPMLVVFYLVWKCFKPYLIGSSSTRVKDEVLIIKCPWLERLSNFLEGKYFILIMPLNISLEYNLSGVLFPSYHFRPEAFSHLSAQLVY